MPNKKKRNGNGEGTIYHNGRYWTGQITIGRDSHTGKIKRKSFYGKTKKEAREKMAAARSLFDSCGYSENSNMPLKDWAEYWLKNFKRSTVAETTYDRYESLVALHIIRPLGQTKLGAITAFQIQEMLNSKCESGLSHGTVSAIRSRLNGMLEKAVELGLLAKNPCKGIIVPKRKGCRGPIALTKEEQRLFVEYCNREKNGQLFIFLLGTGMRISEALGLTWEDIDLENNRINVRRSSCEIRGRAKMSEKTKTPAGHRFIPMCKKVKDILVDIYYRQNREKNKMALVFPSSKYTLTLSSNVRARLAKYCASTGIRRINVHVLRHTFATRAIEQNMNIKLLSYILGHKDIKLTLNTYAHILPEYMAENTCKIDVFEETDALQQHY